MYIGDWMERGERYFADLEAVVDTARKDKRRFTYREMNERANRLARFLRDKAGVSRGARVGILAHNGVEYLDAFFACGKLGAIFVPYNWRLHPDELTQLLDDTRPQCLLYGEELLSSVEAVRPRCPTLTHYLHLSGPGFPGSIPYEEALAESDPAPVKNELVHEEDILCLLFTGGTTGRSKGAKISYRMIAWNTLNTLIHELCRGDVTITHTPMFHTGGLLVYTIPLLTVGGKVVITKRWDPDQILTLLAEEEVTVFFATPTHYQQMMQSPRFAETDLSKLRFLTSGGAPLPVSLIREWQKIHKVPFKQGFGMTEFGPGIFSMAPEYAIEKAGSIGMPNYFIEARLVDDQNREVGVGEAGELVLKGPSRFSGYFGLPDQEEFLDKEGWFHTGDIARKDEDGFYYIVDRKKDMFISGGENVYPAEIEKCLYEHPAVRQCAVVGVPDETWGEVGRAFVVLREGQQIEEEELLTFLRQRLARYKVPKKVIVLEGLPLSPAGKILKRELRERYR